MKILARVLLILAFIGFAVTSVVHIMTFEDINLVQVISNLGGPSFLQVVYVLILVLGFGAMIFLSASPEAGINLWNKFWDRMPLLLRGIISVIFVYVLIGFVLSFNSGVPEKQEDKYVLTKRGDIIRELTEQEYELQQIYIVRYRSGHLLLFYLIPALYFWYFDSTDGWWNKLRKQETG
jgi:hypothetical protein